MKTKYVLETVTEVAFNSDERPRLVGDDMPIISGILEVKNPPDGQSGDSWVQLTNDPAFEFSMPFKQFVIEACEFAGVPLKAQDNIPC